ncbi:MAG: hypothetical protein IPH50_02260 [Rhodanobacteraceae bacterium]|nr:hypothetical protein [Rhodanobacteraceae bacterium]
MASIRSAGATSVVVAAACANEDTIIATASNELHNPIRDFMSILDPARGHWL